MKAIEILSTLCKGWFDLDFCGITKGSAIEADGVAAHFGVINEDDFHAEDGCEYFYYYALKDETIKGLLVDDAWIFQYTQDEDFQLYLWKIDD